MESLRSSLSGQSSMSKTGTIILDKVSFSDLLCFFDIVSPKKVIKIFFFYKTSSNHLILPYTLAVSKAHN